MRAWIYDRTFRSLTTGWYQEVLGRLPHGARILDIGIGTGGALSRNASLLRAKDLSVVGVDIDPDYVAQARKAMADADLTDRVDVHLTSIGDFDQEGFDAAYFGASFMLLPQPAEMLAHASRLLTDEGKVYFTQTFELRRSKLVEVAKPLLHKLTTIHFGTVTYEEDFLATVDQAGLRVVENVALGAGRRRAPRLVVAAPRA